MSKFVTYRQLQKIVQESKVGVHVKIQSNPWGEGKVQVLIFLPLKNGYVSTKWYGQGDIEGIDYSAWYEWRDNYKGRFELVEPATVKPEVYAVGDWVVVTEEAKKCEDYESWLITQPNIIGQECQITETHDTCYGISYELCYMFFPYYAVQRVEPPESEPQTIKVHGKIYLKSEYDSAIAVLEEVKKL